MTRSILDGIPKPKKPSRKPSWRPTKQDADRPSKKALAVLARARAKGIFA